MTLEEAVKIAEIISYADGGCEYCVGKMCTDLSNAFPEYEWSYTGSINPGQANVVIKKKEPIPTTTYQTPVGRLTIIDKEEIDK